MQDSLLGLFEEHAGRTVLARPRLRATLERNRAGSRITLVVPRKHDSGFNIKLVCEKKRIYPFAGAYYDGVWEPGDDKTCGNWTKSGTDGSAIVDVECDPIQGVACNAATGLCEGACAPQNLGTSYIGCEYYPTVTGNDVDESFEFAIDLPLTDPTVVAGLPLHGPNRWPAEYPWLRPAAEAYLEETMALGKRSVTPTWAGTSRRPR